MCESGALTLLNQPDQQVIVYLQKEDQQGIL